MPFVLMVERCGIFDADVRATPLQNSMFDLSGFLA
jgi:hypothetical protein